MPDLDAALEQLLVTLRQARAIVEAEVTLLRTQEDHRQVALRLLEVTRGFTDKSEALVFLLTDNDSALALLDQANTLADAFWRTEETLEAMLGLGKRSPS